MADDYLVELEQAHPRVLPEVLGLDEGMIHKRYRAVFANVEKNTFFEIIEGRLKRELRAYVGTFSMEDRLRVRVLVTDLLKPYRDVAKELFPKAELVPDKFHIVRIANERMKLVHLHVRRELFRKRHPDAVLTVRV